MYNFRDMKKPLALVLGIVASFAIFLNVVQATPEVDTAALISYWNFDEGEGLIATDPVNGHDAELQDSNSMWTDGILDKAIVSLDSTDYAVAAGDFPTGDDPRTLNLWFRHETGVFNEGGHGEHIVNYGFPDSNQAFGVMMFTGGTWWFYGHGGETDIDTGITADDQWHMHTVVYDGTTVSYYLDGTEVASSSRELATAIGGMYFGNRMDANNLNVAHGTIDEVSIWNAALIPSEINALYNEGDGLVYPLDGSTVIDTCAELQSIGIDDSYPLDGAYRLGADIDCSMTDPAADGFDPDGLWGNEQGFLPIGSSTAPFTGTFDGGGHSISYLTIDRLGTDNVGLFGYASTTIKNLTIENFSITANNAVGALVGRLVNGSIQEVTVVDSYVGGDTWVGGLIGRVSNAAIIDSRAIVQIVGRDDVGGFVGIQESGSIASSSVSSFVDAASGANSVGGFVGQMSGGTIADSYASTTVEGMGGTEVGGFAGETYSTITRSYSFGTVFGHWNVGGFVGKNAGSISNSHARGSLEGTHGSLGGFAGVNSGLISTSYAVVTVAGTGEDGELWNVGGFVGDNLNGQGQIASVFSAGTVEVTDNYGQSGTFVGYNGYSVVNSYYWSADDVGQGFVDGLEAEADLAVFRNPAHILYEDWDFPVVWTIDETGEGTRLNAGWPYLVSLSDTYAEEILPEDNEAVVITSCIELQNINENLNGSFVLGNDIDCSMTRPSHEDYFTFVPIGGADGEFTGTFDGAGHVISNLYIDREDGYAGLFGEVFGGKISQVGLASPRIMGLYAVGGLVGELGEGSVIEESYVVGGLIRSTDICTGGLVGISYGAIIASYSRTTVMGSDITGGLVSCNGGVIADSYATGRVSGIAAGGLVGDSCCEALVVSSFWDTETTGQGESSGGQGLNSVAMKDFDTYTTELGGDAWDFSEEGVWAIDAEKNEGYPYLAWQTIWPNASSVGVSAVTGEAKDITQTSVSLFGHYAYPGLTLDELLSGYAFFGMAYGTTSNPDLSDEEDIEVLITELSTTYPNLASPLGDDEIDVEDFLMEGVELPATAEGLECGTTYYYMAVTVWSVDISNPFNIWIDLGEEASFTTLACDDEEEESNESASARSPSVSGSGSSARLLLNQFQSFIERGNYSAAASRLLDWSKPFVNQPVANLSLAGLPVRDLEFGLTGEDVRSLQDILMLQGHGIPAGATGYFGVQTRAALIGYQSSHGIMPAIGYFGPITRAFMKAAGLAGLWW